MNRRLRRSVAASLTAALMAAGATAASPALAGTTDLIDWNLTTSVSSYGGGTQFHISSTGSSVSYRWLDSPNVGTVISGNACSDYSLYGSASIGVGDTSYKFLFSGSTGLCFVMRGRTTSGSLSNHDGRINR